MDFDFFRPKLSFEKYQMSNYYGQNNQNNYKWPKNERDKAIGISDCFSRRAILKYTDKIREKFDEEKNKGVDQKKQRLLVSDSLAIGHFGQSIFVFPWRVYFKTLEII